MSQNPKLFYAFKKRQTSTLKQLKLVWYTPGAEGYVINSRSICWCGPQETTKHVRDMRALSEQIMLKPKCDLRKRRKWLIAAYPEAATLKLDWQGLSRKSTERCHGHNPQPNSKRSAPMYCFLISCMEDALFRGVPQHCASLSGWEIDFPNIGKPFGCCGKAEKKECHISESSPSFGHSMPRLLEIS